MSRRKGIQLCYPFEEKRLAKWKPPYIVQPKYDGERCRAIPVKGSYLLLSSEENIFYSVPHINEALEKFRYTNLEFDGELYCHGMSFEEIHSRVGRTVNLHPDHEAISFHIFDIVTEDPQIKRIGNLYGELSPSKKIPFLTAAPTILAESLSDVMKAYDIYLSQDYEGIIVRNVDAPYLRKRSTFLMKFKPKKEDVYEITGWKEEVSIDGYPKGRLGALVCRGDDGTEFSVGSGLNDYLREILWLCRDELAGKSVKVAYQHITSGKKVPRFPVFVEVIED